MPKKSFEDLLQKNHLKRTKARVLILKILEKGGPKTAAEVFSQVMKTDKRMSLSTVYRNCEILAANDILFKSTSMSDGLTYYEYANDKPLYHGVCIHCHQIIPIDVNLEEGYEAKLLSRYGFEAERPRIEIYGVCKNCRKKK